MFYAPDQFPFVAALEESWREIYQEYLGITGDLMDWFEKDLYGEGWRVFGLFDFPHGKPIEANTGRCPLTASLIEQHITC